VKRIISGEQGGAWRGWVLERRNRAPEPEGSYDSVGKRGKIKAVHTTQSRDVQIQEWKTPGNPIMVMNVGK